jgi:hypothetical protein
MRMSSSKRRAAMNLCELLDLVRCEFDLLSVDGLRGDRAIEAFDSSQCRKQLHP